LEAEETEWEETFSAAISLSRHAFCPADHHIFSFNQLEVNATTQFIKKMKINNSRREVSKVDAEQKDEDNVKSTTA